MSIDSPSAPVTSQIGKEEIFFELFSNQQRRCERELGTKNNTQPRVVD